MFDVSAHKSVPKSTILRYVDPVVFREGLLIEAGGEVASLGSSRKIQPSTFASMRSRNSPSGNARSVTEVFRQQIFSVRVHLGLSRSIDADIIAAQLHMFESAP